MNLLMDNVLQIIFHETNRYHEQNALNDNSWKDVTPTKMIAFFGINIAMSMVKLPEISSYWKESGVMEVSRFRWIFTRKRFYDISKYLHLADNIKTPQKTNPNYKLQKRGGIFEVRATSLKSGYRPCQQIAIDEQMIGTVARISFLQYIPKKSKKFGVKFWALCEPTSGYCLCFQLCKEKPFQKPVIINEYNKFMGGVDQCDHVLSSYSRAENQSSSGKRYFFECWKLQW